MCVIKASIYENLLTTFLDFKIVAWRFPSILATALVGLSVTFRCGAVTYDTLRTHLLSSGFRFLSAAAQGYASSVLFTPFTARFHSRQKSRKRIGDNSV